jgi:hypothetical protein
MVKIWTEHRGIVLALNASEARKFGAALARGLELAADATERATRGEPRVLPDESLHDGSRTFIPGGDDAKR